MVEENTLKELIQQTDLTYRELAQRMGIKHPQLVALCRPGANPTLKTLIKLARELKVSLNQLALAFGEDIDRNHNDIGGDEPISTDS